MEIIYNGQKDDRLFSAVIGETIDELMKEDPSIVWLDADLMSCSGTKKYAQENERYINCGIAEANMIGVGCGLSASGMKPYAHTFGPFASRRCYDQVFLSGAYAGNNITIIGTDPGITAAFNGGTHMPFEDVALYRAIPNAIIIDITDVPMLKDVLRKVKDISGVKYLRVSRKDSYQVYSDNTTFTFGKGNVLRKGDDAVIIACGIMVHEAMQAAKILEEIGIQTTVIDIFTIKPIDKELVLQYVRRTGVVVTAENHNKIGGLYSAVKEIVDGDISVGYVAVEDEFGEVGPQDYLRDRYGLTAEHIAKIVEEKVLRK